MPKAELQIQAGIAEGELQPTFTQLTDLSKSCIKSKVDLLGPEKKLQLKSIIAELRADVTKASDLLHTRQGHIRKSIDELKEELSALDTGQKTISDFYRLMADAIASCPDAEQAATRVKKVTDRVLQQANELNYRILIAGIQEGGLNGEIQEADDTLGVLDRVNLTL